MGSTKNVDMSATQDKIKIVQSNMLETTEGNNLTLSENVEQASEDAANEPKAASKKARARSGKYTAARSQVDKTKKYDAFSAIELLKRLSYSKFDGTVELHAVVREVGTSVTMSFPHTTGKSRVVAIADDKVLAEIEAGNINFDVLVASPDMMPKLTKFARVLGPKGLMPNPKMGTLTPNPEKAKELLEGGSITIKTEKKAPLVHVTIGKVSHDTKNLVENIEAFAKKLKGKLLRLSISASMSPGIKVAFEE